MPMDRLDVVPNLFLLHGAIGPTCHNMNKVFVFVYQRVDLIFPIIMADLTASLNSSGCVCRENRCKITNL